MNVRFWGARGSLPSPGPTTVRYGGNTSCVEITTSGGALIIIDCGTGIRRLGQHLQAKQRTPISGHILLSHTHWDHIQGIPFFEPFFTPNNTWDVYAPKGVRGSLRSALEGQMQYSYFPVELDELGAQIRYHDLIEGTFQIADVTVRTRYLNHPALTFGYRLEVDGATIVYASDHEPHSRQLADGTGEIAGEDLRHCEFLRGADLVIHDARYTAEEYPQKIGWGHSTIEYALALCRAGGVKRVCLTHHDPSRDDDEIDRIVAKARAELQRSAPGMQVIAAAESTTLTIQGEGKRPARTEPDQSAISEATAIAANPLIVLAARDRSVADTVLNAALADRVPVIEARSADAVLRIVDEKQPSLVLLEQPEGAENPLQLCKEIRALEGAPDIPIIVIAGREDHRAGLDAGVTDWLIRPFSVAYARTRIRAWLLRTEARWVRAPIPSDEERRLATLHGLGILDTPREERFDRLTRLAASILLVPVALVSLVDQERQWFKSAHGVEINQAPRETSFCAHAVADRKLMLIPDALTDIRFADNPDVRRMRVRFYAGCPLFVRESCVGTLCVLDVRPRHLTEEQIALLKDVAALVERELQVPAH